MHNVYIVDTETISPLGVSTRSHFEEVIKGTSGCDYITQFDATTFPTKFACEVTGDLTPLRKMVSAEIRSSFPYDRKAELFCCCAQLLKERVSKRLHSIPAGQIGVFVGAGMEELSLEYLKDNSLMHEIDGLEQFFRQNKQIPFVNKLLNPSNFFSLYAASIFGANGPRNTNLSACAASTQALGAAWQSISLGECAVAIVGGVDSTVHPFILTAFSLLDMLSTRNDTPASASRPFDASRDGFVPGEGAGFVVLVNDEYADRWPPMARLAGYGSSLDAYKITAPHPDGKGAQLAMKRALRTAGWATDSVDYINAHGTSTPLNDPAECRAIQQVFGDALDKILVSSTKSQIGHLIAAGGIVEFITVVAALAHGIVPPSINVTKQDRQCAVTLPTTAGGSERGQEVKINRALSNSFALAGQNATVAVCTV